jgi:hypothetical protein
MNQILPVQFRREAVHSHVWKLHPEADLGVPLAVSSMDWEGAAYTDTDRKQGGV